MQTVPAGFDIARRFSAICYFLVLLAVLAFCSAPEQENYSLLFLAGLACAMSWFMVEGPKGTPLPRLMVNIGVLTTSLILLGELLFSARPNLLLGLGHFMTGIVLCKMFERKTGRDYVQILALSLLIMVAGAIFSSSVWFAIFLGIFLSVGLYGILLLHLRIETDIAGASGPMGYMYVPLSEQPFIRRDMRRVTTWSASLLLAVAIAVFLAVPRSPGQGFLSNWSMDTIVQTGFSSTVQFRENGRMQQSDAVVMDVKLAQNGVNIGSEVYQPYFRGTVLDAYDPGRKTWVKQGHEGWRDRDADDDKDIVDVEDTKQLIEPKDYADTGTVTQEYSLHSFTENVLFSIAPAVSISAEHPIQLRCNVRDRSIVATGSPPASLKYTIVSAAVFKPSVWEGDLRITPGYLGLVSRAGPFGWLGGDSEETVSSTVPPQVTELARKVAKDLLPERGLLPLSQFRAVADRFEVYLRENYPYSLTFHMQDTSLDPTADFLLNRKRTGGHCEYFASAMVMMCRSVGINARMVTGFHGGEFNAIGGYYSVKRKDAHAWAEVYLQDRGWATYDPSPVESDTASSFPMFRWLRDVGDVIQRAWMSAVVAFDNSSRNYLLSLVRSTVGWISANIRILFDESVSGFHDIFLAPTTSFALRTAGIASVGFVLALTGWLISQWNRRRHSEVERIISRVDRKVQRQLAAELMFFDDMLHLLGRTGQRKRSTQTPREYVDQLKPSLGETAPDAYWLVGTFYEIRFGTLRMTGVLRDRIARSLQRIRHQIQRKA